MAKPTIYLAGPMTGIPEFNFPLFNEAAKHLEAEGWSVFNPARNFDGATDLPRETYMRQDFKALLEADAIALLPDWQDSEGALAEAMMAKQLALPAYLVEPARGGKLETIGVDLSLNTILKSRKAQAEHAKREAEAAAAWASGVAKAKAEIAAAKTTESVLEEAQRLVGGDRGADYGHPLDDYNKTGMMWGALLHSWAKEAAKHQAPIPIPADLACLMMVAMKLSRQVNKRKRDNLVDGAGYLLCSAMCLKESDRRLAGNKEE